MFPLLALVSCSTGVNKPGAPTTEIPVSQIDASAPIVVSQKPGDKELCSSIGKEIDKRGASHERWGLLVVSMKDGRALCTRDPRKLFAPASVLKVVTAAVALEKLGPEFRFETSVYSESNIKNNELRSELVLYGRGAPDFDEAGMKSLVGALKAKGIKKINGDIVGDTSYFRADGLGDGWTWNEAQWYYGAAATALSYERNIVRIEIKNGKPSADSEFVELSGELQPAGEIEAIGIKRKLGTNSVYVWGNGSSLKARIAISNPALFTARVFKETLEKNGIEVDGEARSADWIKPTGAESGEKLASVQSATVAELIRTMNKDSINLYAELLLRAIGKNFGSEAPNPDPKIDKLRGDDAAGAAVVLKYLSDKGLQTDKLALHDGSGLSRLDRLTPESIVRILLLAAEGPHAKAFADSLPVSGIDGTMRGRLNELTGRVSAKTGSIKYSNSLAGYLKRGDETLAFAVICNDETNRKDSTATIDEIIRLSAR